ncbi:MAG: adenylate kinase [Promethearchaeota archaeon]
MKRLIIFGAPGSGKGTFAGRIKHVMPNIIHISTGDIFRANLKEKTPLGIKAKEYMDKGELVPDDIVIDMVRNRLNQDDVKKNGFILDGFPRTLNQTEALTKITDIDKVILMEVSEDVLLKRILGRYACQNCGYTYNKYFLPPKKEGTCDNCGKDIIFEQRSDDTEDAIKTRLQAYEANAKPIIDYYEKQGIVKRVDSTKTLEFSHEEILEIIN